MLINWRRVAIRDIRTPSVLAKESKKAQLETLDFVDFCTFSQAPDEFPGTPLKLFPHIRGPPFQPD
jgi:hypothetical protein